MDGDRFTVRKVCHQGGSLSYWVFTPDAEVHRPSLNVLKRYGTSSQQTFAYGLADHLNWARVNGKTPETVTLEDLQRYMNGVTDQADGVYGIAWRKPQQTPLGASAAGNVATVVKAYYLTLSTSQPVNPDLVEARIESSARATARRRRDGMAREPTRARIVRSLCHHALRPRR